MKMTSEERIHEEAIELLESRKDGVKSLAIFCGLFALGPFIGTILSIVYGTLLWIPTTMFAFLIFSPFFFFGLKPYLLVRKSVTARTYIYEYLDIDEYCPRENDVVAIYHYDGEAYGVPLETAKITEDTLRPKKVHVFDFGNPEKGKSFVEAFIDDEEEA